MVPDKRLDEARELARHDHFFMAVAAYEKLTRVYPHVAQIWFEYACSAGSARQMDEAERAWKRAQELAPDHYEMQLQMGHQWQNCRKMDKARAAFERAAAINPLSMDPRIALAMFFERIHQFAEAREAVASCLKLDSTDDQALYLSALLDRRENKLAEAERGLRDLIAAGPRHQFVKYASRYELAEVLNRTERYDEAMQMLKEAKQLLGTMADVPMLQSQYDDTVSRFKAHTLGLPKNILRAWAREFPERKREPIPRLAFLGGHPRSGTTLLEQVLGAHPDVAAVDESLAFELFAGRLHNQSPQLPPARLNVIRRRYIEAICAEIGDDKKGRLILDKNPSPTAQLRIWLRVFPELRVIMALRDPRDVVVSCYFQNIPLNSDNSNFLSLERAARHYANLMDVWLAVRQWEGLAAIETRYEDVVADLAKEGRRVTEFLGLGWHEEQERFHEKSSKKRIHSPTYHDASQPVYKGSVARWAVYEKHLAPAMPILKPYCRAFGYQ